MRIRTIKPEFFLHEALFELEIETQLPVRLAFIGLWCAADREGRFKWEPRKLGIQILPYDSIDFSRVLDALSSRGFILKYASTSGEIGLIPSFPRHQIINNREKLSELPAPPESLEYQAFDACTTREERNDDVEKFPLSGREGKGKEGNMEGKGTSTPKAPKGAASLSPEQIEVGSWFGRRASTAWSEKEAKAWAKLSPDSVTEGITVLAPPYRAKVKFTRQDLQTLLNNWLGEIDRWRNWKPPVASDVKPLASGDGLSFLDDPQAVFFAEDRERELAMANQS